MIRPRLHQPRPDLYYRRLVDGGMLYDETSGQVHHFNLTAARIWEACMLGKEQREMVDELAAEFGLERQRVEGDVADLLDDFATAGLFEE